MASNENLINRDGAEQHLFYNVMPPLDDGKEKIVAAKIDPIAGHTGADALKEAEASTLVAEMAKGRTGSKKKVFIVLAALLLLAMAGGVYWFTQSDAKPEPITLPEIKDEEPKPAPEPEPIPEVTTPKEWLLQYFGKEDCSEVPTCGDASDPERDGLSNIDEYKLGTDPNNRDSDGDGLADGDEVHVFASSPTRIRTANDPDYDDTDYARGGYDVATRETYSETRLREIKEAMQTYGLHLPTVESLDEALLDIYGFSESSSLNGGAQPKGSELPVGFEATPEAKLDRDSQRMATIKKIGIALVDYKKAGTTYPTTTDFGQMATTIKPYLRSATNTEDPIGQAPFVYGYTSESAGAAFTLTYYSETQGQLIRYRSATAEQDATKEQAQGADEQRKADLESIRSALLLYGAAASEASSGEFFIFPPKASYKTDLSPTFMSEVPKDPKTGKDYEYEVSALFDSFTIKAVLENPAAGTTGYLCNQEECRAY